LIQLLSSHYMFFFLTPRLPELCMTSDAARIAASVARAVHSKGDEEFRAFQETLGEYTAAGWVQPLAMRSMINYYRCLLLTLADRVPREQRRIEVPTLLLWGERDTALDLGLAQLPKALVAQGVVHVVPGATHFVQRDAYEEVNERMAKFLKDAK
jgi:pimeloyl-ACP methyl ester carboxylesterase